MKAVWIYEKNKNALLQKAIGFRIRHDKEELEYFGDDVVLHKLKESFSKYIFQVKF